MLDGAGLDGSCDALLLDGHLVLRLEQRGSADGSQSLGSCPALPPTEETEAAVAGYAVINGARIPLSWPLERPIRPANRPWSDGVQVQMKKMDRVWLCSSMCASPWDEKGFGSFATASIHGFKPWTIKSMHLIACFFAYFRKRKENEYSFKKSNPFTWSSLMCNSYHKKLQTCNTTFFGLHLHFLNEKTTASMFGVVS